MSHQSLDREGRLVNTGITRNELLTFRETVTPVKDPIAGSGLAGLTRLAWRDHAACIGADPDLFFPDKGDTRKLAAARAYCARCPVTAECLDEIMSMPRAFLELGVWGGTSGNQRRSMIAKARQPERQPDPRPPVACKFCRTEFTPPNRNTLYCSKKCKTKRDNQTRWAARKAKGAA